MNYETENIEFKSQFTPEIYKEVIAFANTDGGIIYVGIDDNGQVIGLENVDEEYTKITNGIRDAIMPDVTMFVKFRIQENHVVSISVNEGSTKPYYLKSKGLKPSGVYIRQGASSVPASPEMIRNMIKLSDGDVFEEMRSLEQELTFHYAALAFQKNTVEFSPEKYLTLGMIQKNDTLYTNLALLLSDQCPYTVKIAVFGDETKTTFRDAQEFGGSVLQQINDSFSYLKLNNKTTAIFKELERIEYPDYPEEALREALLNAVIHRSYSFSGSIIINITDQETEFISMGGLLPDLSVEDIRSGISQPRNKKLADVFHRLKLIESYGTGIRKIFHFYQSCAAQPRIEVTQNTFRLILPNMNYYKNQVEAEKPHFIVTDQMQRVLDYITEKEKVTNNDLEELLGVKSTRIYTITRKMIQHDLIIPVGKGKNKYYILK